MTSKRCSWWHILVWLAYVGLLCWGIDVMLGHWLSGFADTFLWPIVLFQGIVIPILAGSFADRWLDGGNRSVSFRFALGCTALLSAIFALLWFRYGCYFLLFRAVGGFQAPMARFSWTVFCEGLVMGVVAMAAYGAFAWLSLRTAYLLFLTAKTCNLDLIFEQRRRHEDVVLPTHTVRPAPVQAPAPAPAPAPMPALVDWNALSDAQRAAILRTAADLVVPHYSHPNPDKIALLYRHHPELDLAAGKEAIRLATAALCEVDSAYYNLGCGPPQPGEVDPEPALRAKYPWMSDDAMQLARGVALNNARRG